MLHEFLTSNRAELIDRCQDKSAARRAIDPALDEAVNGAPLFLAQLVEVLVGEEAKPTHKSDPPERTPAPSEIGRAAALHGANLLRRGYSVDMVIHEYGDICQSVTELAIERGQFISTNEFRILNRSLDNAIADAVTAYGRDREVSVIEQAEEVGGHLDHFSGAEQGLLDTAIQSFTALQTGRLGLNGATASAHLQSLHALRALTDQSVSAVRLASARSTLRPSN